MADRIEIDAHRDDDAGMAAAVWFQRRALSRFEWSLMLVVNYWLPSIVIAVSTGIVVQIVFAPPDNLAVLPAAVVGVLGYFLLIGWAKGMGTRIYEAHARDGVDPVRMIFDPRGFTRASATSEARYDWAGVSAAELTPEGFFVAANGVAYYIAPKSWASRTEMTDDAETIIGWWHAGGGAG